MSINVKTENNKDATIQVHIAFENAGYHRNTRKKRRAVKQRNTAALRGADQITLTTGKNQAEHQSTRRKRLTQQRKALPKPDDEFSL